MTSTTDQGWEAKVFTNAGNQMTQAFGADLAARVENRAKRAILMLAQEFPEAGRENLILAVLGGAVSLASMKATAVAGGSAPDPELAAQAHSHIKKSAERARRIFSCPQIPA